MKKTKVRLPKYAGGTSIVNYIQDPSAGLAKNDIHLAEAKYKAATNPLVQGMKLAGGIGMQVGDMMGGFSGLQSKGKTVDPKLAQGLEALTQGLGSASSLFAKGGKVRASKLDKDTYGIIEDFAGSNQISINDTLDLLQQYAGGGTVIGNQFDKSKAQVPVEVEGNEMGETPGGQVMDFKGPTHENGGIPVALPEGTDIYSDRITIDGKTMAERKRERESIASRYKKRADKGDALSKNALNRIMVSNAKQDELDRRVQDALNTSNQRQSFAKGTKLTGITYTPPIGNEPENLYTVNELYNDPTKGLISRTVDKTQAEILGPSKIFNNSVKNTTLRDAAAITGEALPTYEKVPSYLPETDKNNTVTNTGMGLTGGDILNMAGNAFSGVAPYLNTLKNRATDTPNINAYKNYGVEGLQKMSQSEDYLKRATDEALKSLEGQRQSMTSQNRRTARGVNTMRALDLAAYESANKSQGDIYGNYAKDMMNIMSQEAQMENQQDQMVMQGEQTRDLADRADKDAYYNAKGQGLANLGATAAQIGNQINQSKERDNTMKLYNSMYNNFGYDAKTGTVVGKAAESLGLKEGSIAYPNDIVDAWNRGQSFIPGTDQKKRFKSLKEMQAFYKDEVGISAENAASVDNSKQSPKKK